MPFLDIKDMEFENKRALVRVGMDVSVDNEGNIIDDKRIVSCIPTIQYLIDKNAKIILMLHLGRPKGFEKHLTTDIVAKRLSRFLFRPVEKVDACTGKDVKKKISEMMPGDIIFLENLRFYGGETSNCPAFAKELAGLGDAYVNECFSVSHREHASIVGIPRHLPGCGGFCFRKEVEALKRIIKCPEKPFVAVLGGVKGDKIDALKKLIEKADSILVGGGLAFLMLKIRGYNVGKSKIDFQWASEEAKKEIAEIAMSKKIILPLDFIAAKEPSEESEDIIMDVTMGSSKMRSEFMGLDIGPRTIGLYKKILSEAKTVVWAGPMGLFEIEKYSAGTREIAKCLAEIAANKNATVVVGGGETAFAVEKFNLADKMSHISTGGGAFLAFIAKESLPAIEELAKAKERFKQESKQEKM